MAQGNVGEAGAGYAASLRRAVPRPAGWRAGAGSLVGARIAACFAEEAEKRRLFPWLAVAFGIGIALCLTLTDGLPSVWAGFSAAALAGAPLPFLRRRPVTHAIALAFVFASLGFGLAAMRMVQAAGPVLARTTIAPLTGWIESLEEREGGARLVLRVRSIGTLDAASLPVRVRASHRARRDLRPGDFIAASARLLPPPEAARPGGYDFARDAFFRGIGAVGSLTGKIEILASPEPVPWNLRLAAAIDDARNALTRRIMAANGGQAGAVAAALVTGKRGQINEATNAILRSAGIYHVVSISGLHMVLAAGVVFWLVRAVLALVPALALAWPIKKIAALCAMAGVTGYCAFSGWDVAAGRALIMTLVMLGAILVDRPALSMRNLAIAAMAALAREPEALLGPSFQMSFGAVAGLIACAPLLDRIPLVRERFSRSGGIVAAGIRAVLVTLATTLVAQIATAPFATFHFQTIQPFGLLGNALTLPLVSLAVMPSAVAGMIAYPFALDRPVWFLMGLAVRGMLGISAWIAGFSRADIVVPAFGPSALALLAGGLLLATLCVSSLRWTALAPAVAGLMLALAPARHDVFIDREGAGAAVRTREGRLAVLGRPPDFVLEQWLRADGDARTAAQARGDGAGRCDRLGCTIVAVDGRTVAFAADKRAFHEDCARADLVVSPREAPPGCDALVVIDRRFLARHGATALRLTPGWPRVETVRDPDRLPAWRAAIPARGPPPPPAAASPVAVTDGETGPAGSDPAQDPFQ